MSENSSKKELFSEIPYLENMAQSSHDEFLTVHNRNKHFTLNSLYHPIIKDRERKAQRKKEKGERIDENERNKNDRNKYESSN